MGMLISHTINLTFDLMIVHCGNLKEFRSYVLCLHFLADGHHKLIRW